MMPETPCPAPHAVTELPSNEPVDRHLISTSLLIILTSQMHLFILCEL